VRGDRRSDVLPFPSLQREADILGVLEAGGIPVPHVHGMCGDPYAIVMDAVAGVRDVTQLPAEQAQALATEYVELLVKMHALDIKDFVAIGLAEPTTPEQIGLGMLEAYLPLYQRTKAGPEPLIEFAMAWARRNVPQHRTSPSFVHFDAGQFLHQDGRITSLYDFETCLIGDPMMDLAALRMRNPAEPIGAELSHLFDSYATLSGAPVDLAALRFHTVVFALVGVMALAGTMVEPLAGSPHLEYLWWDLMQRRTLVWALAECLDVAIDRPAVVPPTPSARAPVLRMLEDAIGQLTPATKQDRYQQRSLSLLARCATHADAVGPELDAQSTAEIARLTGTTPGSRADADRALERFVLSAGAEHDTELARLLGRDVERSVLTYAPLADRLVGYDLAPVVL
jgi:aminoglycoside phosphotransferase (APT) family kinase protein